MTSNFFLIIEPKSLAYLDLAVESKTRIINSIDNYKFKCRFTPNFNHELHSANKHLNSITDLIISLGSHLEENNLEIKSNFKKLQEIIKKLITTCFNIKTDVLKLISKNSENLDFIKIQNSEIFSELKQLKHKIPSKPELDKLSLLITQSKPKQIELRTLSLIEKHDSQLKDFDIKLAEFARQLATIKHMVT